MTGPAAIVVRAAALATGEYLEWLAQPSAEPGHVVAGGGVQVRRIVPRPGGVVQHASDHGRVLHGRLGFRPTNEMLDHGMPATPVRPTMNL